MAGSINLANVALGFDASQITRGVDLTAGELRKLSGIVKSSESDLDKYSNSMRLLDVAQQKGAVTADRLAAAQDQLSKKYGIETYAMIEARQAAESLAKAKADELAKNQKIDSEMQLGIALRKQVATAEEMLAADTRIYSGYLKQGIIDLKTYNQLLESQARKYGIETDATRAATKAAHDLARTQKEQIEKQKQLDAEMQIGIALRKQVATADERMATSIKQYDTYLKQGIIDLQTYNRLLGQMQAKPMQTPMSGGGIAGDLKGTLAQYAGMAAAFAVVKKSLSLAAVAETNKIALEVLTGSTEKAKMLYDGFIALDRESPLSRSDFSRASQTLIGYGFAAEGTLPTLRALSQISAGNSDKFHALALAFGQVTANGRLMGQELLQMTNAQFNPLAEIARTTGRDISELNVAMQAGAISSGMVEDAFASATTGLGRFSGMNERLSQTAAGQYAKMQSDVQLLATEIGTNLMPAAKAFLDLLRAGSNGQGGSGFLSNIASAFSTGLEGIGAIASDAFTNLDGSSNGTKLTELRNRVNAAQMENDLRKEFVHVNTKADNERIAKTMAERENEKRMILERKKLADDTQKAAEVQHEKWAKQVAEDEKRQAKELKHQDDLAQREAKRILDIERRKDEVRRRDVAKGPGAGMEVGSAEAAKFIADQINQVLSDKMDPNGNPTRQQMDMQLNKLDELITVAKANGFRQI